MDIEPSLVFVIGAGASKDFGPSMPIGTQLAARIEENLNNEFGGGRSLFAIEGPISAAISSGGQGGFHQAHVDAANRIRRAIHTKDSIDDLLDDWREVPGVTEIGRLAIAHAILEAENSCGLARNIETEDGFLTTIGTMRDTWLAQIVKYCAPGQSRRMLPEALQDIGFVIFNYDRCVETMLAHWRAVLQHRHEH